MNTHSIKSGAITFVSFLVTVIGVLQVTPEWSTFVNWASISFNNKLIGLGVPTAIIGIITVLIDRGWKAFLNNRIVKNAERKRMGMASGGGVQLY